MAKIFVFSRTHGEETTSTDWKEKEKNKSREETFYQMKVFFC